MHTELLKLDGSALDTAKIRHAARLLQAGALVAFPTETVYALGADSRNPEALARLAKAKSRNEGKPYSLLLPSLVQAEQISGGLDRVATKLARLYWPGPLTLVVPRRGGGSAGMRISEHPLTRALLAQCGFALAAPSANRSGTKEPITAEQVLEELAGEIALVLDGGPAWQGRPSTVVRLDVPNAPQIQRDGPIPKSEIVEAARPTILFVCTGNTCRSPMAAALCLKELTEHPIPGLMLSCRVLSAGTAAREGRRADPLAQESLGEWNLDLSWHRTRALTPNLVDHADWIFTMTRAHRESIVKMMPDADERVRLFSPEGDDIPDPVTGSIAAYRHVRDLVGRAMPAILKALAKPQ